MAKILITDDEIDIQDLIKGFAQREGHEIKCASSGSQAVELCTNEDFDLIIMDVMMDDMDGFTATKEIKKLKDIPVLMLTALGAEYDKLHGFDLGIEDYVTKPFSPRELMARVNVILRRKEKENVLMNSLAPGSFAQHPVINEPLKQVQDDNESTILCGDIKIEPLSRDVFINNKKIDLTAKEFDLLLFFVNHQNQALNRQQIINGVWGENYYCDDRTVDWQVKLLRKNLGSCSKYIQTMRGVGYKFEV